MSNQNGGRRFLARFFRGLFLFLLMIGVGVISYKGVFLYCEYMHNRDKIASVKERDGKMYAVILLEDKNQKGIKGVMVRVLQPSLNTVDFFVIPSNTKISTSGEVYQELKESGRTLLDVTTMKDLITIVGEDEPYEYVVKAVGELIHCDSLSQYEIYTQDTIVSMVESLKQYGKQIQFQVPMPITADYNGEKVTVNQGSQLLDGKMASALLFFEQYQNGAVDQAKVIAQFLGKVYQTVGALSKEEKIEWNQKFYAHVQGNQEDKMKSALGQSFAATVASSYRFHLIAGYDTRDSYDSNEEKNQKLFQDIVENKDEYNGEQDLSIFELDPIMMSKDLSIMLCNGTKIGGLAKVWKDKLEQNGYHRIVGLGNDNAVPKEETVIYVRADDVGLDLYAYFPKAKFIVDPTLSGVDIKIVIGKLDA